MRKLSQGEPVKIAADDYNRWQEAGRAHAMSRLNQSQQIVTPDAQEGIVLVKNTLSRVMPRFSVLGLRGSVYNPLYSDQQLTEFKNQIALIGETPSSVTSGRFCVLQNDAQPGEVVAGMVSGVTPCRVKVESLTDEFAEIETTTTVDQTRYLKSGGTGSAQILFRPEYLGEQWGVVRLGNRVGGEQVFLAEFKTHSSPDPTYNYPLPSDGTLDVVFPAYIVDGPTFDDEPIFSKTAFPTATGLGEAVFVHSLRRTYVLPKVASGFFYPVYKINDKYWIDQVPLWPRVAYSANTTSATVSASSSVDINSAVAVTYEGLASSTYSPINVSSTGVITAYYKCRALVTVSACIQVGSFAGSTSIAGTIDQAGTAAAAPAAMPAMHYEFLKPAAGTTYATGRITVSTQGLFNFSAGDTLSFKITNGSGGDVTLQSFGVTIDPAYGVP